MTDYEVVNKSELPEDSATQVVKYDVKLFYDDSVYKKGFNLDPGQNLEPHIKAWEREVENRTS